MHPSSTFIALVALLGNTASARPAHTPRSSTAGAIADVVGIPPPAVGEPHDPKVSTTQTVAIIPAAPTPPTIPLSDPTPIGGASKPPLGPYNEEYAPNAPSSGSKPPSNPPAQAAEASESGSESASAPVPGLAGLTLYQQLALAPNAVARQALLKDEEFIFKFNDPLRKEGVASGDGGSIVRADHATFPALVGQGGALAIGFLGPCGFNTPHVHPRAAELNLVIEGHLFANVIYENGARFLNHTMSKYEMTVFPMGAVHTEFNPDCTPSVFVAAFPHEDVSIDLGHTYPTILFKREFANIST